MEKVSTSKQSTYMAHVIRSSSSVTNEKTGNVAVQVPTIDRFQIFKRGKVTEVFRPAVNSEETCK